MRFLLTVIACLTCVSAQAGFGEMPSYAEVENGYLYLFEQIAKAKGLDNEYSKAAQQSAAAWYYMWPCKGKIGPKTLMTSEIGHLGPERIKQGQDSASIVHNAVSNPLLGRNAWEAAILEMVAVMTVSDFGQQRNENTCRFAEKLGFPITPSTAAAR
jgi:hypothetical protein